MKNKFIMVLLEYSLNEIYFKKIVFFMIINCQPSKS